MRFQFLPMRTILKMLKNSPVQTKGAILFILNHMNSGWVLIIMIQYGGIISDSLARGVFLTPLAGHFYRFSSC